MEGERVALFRAQLANDPDLGTASEIWPTLRSRENNDAFWLAAYRAVSDPLHVPRETPLAARALAAAVCGRVRDRIQYYMNAMILVHSPYVLRGTVDIVGTRRRPTLGALFDAPYVDEVVYYHWPQLRMRWDNGEQLLLGMPTDVALDLYYTPILPRTQAFVQRILATTHLPPKEQTHLVRSLTDTSPSNRFHGCGSLAGVFTRRPRIHDRGFTTLRWRALLDGILTTLGSFADQISFLGALFYGCIHVNEVLTREVAGAFGRVLFTALLNGASSVSQMGPLYQCASVDQWAIIAASLLRPPWRYSRSAFSWSTGARGNSKILNTFLLMERGWCSVDHGHAPLLDLHRLSKVVTDTMTEPVGNVAKALLDRMDSDPRPGPAT